MAGVLRTRCPDNHRRWLVVGATGKESAAVAHARGPGGAPGAGAWPAIVHRDADMGVVVCGVGKSAGAAAVARVLDPDRHAGVVSIGLAGALPGSGLQIGDIVIASQMVLADEGSENPDGFTDLGAMGFGPMRDRSVSASSDPELVRLLASAIGSARVGTIATVSTCSGTDARAREIARRTGAIAEAMEGAAVALAAQLTADGALPVIEIRAISNTTGDRPNQRWDLEAGFAALRRIGEVL